MIYLLFLFALFILFKFPFILSYKLSNQYLFNSHFPFLFYLLLVSSLSVLYILYFFPLFTLFYYISFIVIGIFLDHPSSLI
jgi:hypothetical protein